MKLKYEIYQFTPVLGWSISRYELFNKCKRQYYYSYYSKYVSDVPRYKMTQLKDLTSIPLEIGNIVHDVLEAFLKRLQKSDSDIDEQRFFQYAAKLAERYFSEKTFMEKYYGYTENIDMEQVKLKIDSCLRNFIESPCFSWIFMVAVRGRENWMIEPSGFGETRLNGLKAYCKMDFLLPVDNDIYILDWKTGARDELKHASQLMGYAAATSNNFGIPWDRIFPKIIYLYPSYDELEIKFDVSGLERFYETIHRQTQQMYSFCSNFEENIPLAIDTFPKSPSPALCRQCRFQELCFPERNTNVCKEMMDFSKNAVDLL